MSAQEGLVQLTRAAMSSRPGAYLGPWCGNERGRILVQDNNDVELAEAVALRKNAYDLSLRVLSDYLNDTHGLKKPQVFWETLLFRFLTLYLDELVCRYFFVRKSREVSGAMFAILDSEDYYIPENDRAALDRYDSSDRFNLQLFSQLYEACGAPVAAFKASQFIFPREVRPNPWGRSVLPKPLTNTAKRIITAIRPAWTYPNRSFGKRDIALMPSFFSEKDLAYISSGEAFRFVQPELGYSFEQHRHADTKARAAVPEHAATNEFERAALRSLRANLPKDYIENFPSMRKRALRHIERKGIPRYIFGNFFPDALDRLWMAECKERGSKILIGQHGGVYGESQKPFWEESERRIADQYLSWGWTKGEPNVRPMPGTRLLRAKRTKGRARSDAVFVLRTNYRYPKFMYALGISSDEREREFAKALPAPILSHTVVRIRADSFSMQNLQGRWLRDVPEMKADWSGRNIYEQLDNAKLVVIDYLFSTTFAECVSANIPVIAFAPDQKPLIDPSAQECFDKLYTAGVLQEDARSAARLVTEVFDDPEAWWMQPERQRAIARYRDMYANAQGGLDAWKRYFGSLAL